MDMSKIKDRRMIAAIGLMSRANVGYVSMRNIQSVNSTEYLLELYPDKSDAEAMVLLAIQFAYANVSTYMDFITEQVGKKRGREA